MNNRVVDEASKLVKLPDDIHNWTIVDIGEDHRTDDKAREQYEEEIYQEIINEVDKLFPVSCGLAVSGDIKSHINNFTNIASIIQWSYP